MKHNDDYRTERAEADPGMIKRPKVLWEKEAARYGADLDRVQVWDAFSELYLDSYRTEPELQHLGELIADSPFSNEELKHILVSEVSPVCGPNLFCLPGGEWAGFPPDTLIPGCLERQLANPYSQGARKPLLSFFCWLLYLEPCLLLKRVERIRAQRLSPGADVSDHET